MYSSHDAFSQVMENIINDLLKDIYNVINNNNNKFNNNSDYNLHTI